MHKRRVNWVQVTEVRNERYRELKGTVRNER